MPSSNNDNNQKNSAPVLDAMLDSESGKSSSATKPKTNPNMGQEYKTFYRGVELNTAMQIAKSRERFRWATAYTSTLTVGACLQYLARGRFPSLMLLPISASLFWTAWEYDLGYGSKIDRLSIEASSVIQNEKTRFIGNK
eukprot:gb/GECH01012489.1/.p1 GENE.gb/GECH01012489.1/~~gb/GECH01012489.1/.p1  ORF type:complete len:140 (+),score=28.67 gb/GECH01012489.1/:1-420(+)